MYKIDKIPPYNENPWDTAFEYRLYRLEEAHDAGKQIILFLYGEMDNSTFRYRVYNVCQTLEKSEGKKGVYFFEHEIDKILKYMHYFDIVSIVRIRWTHPLDRFIRLVRAKNIPVIFDVDDLVFDLNYLALVTNTLGVPFNHPGDYDFWFACIGRVEATAALADIFTTTNPFLGNLLNKKFNKEFKIIPNYLNEEQYSASMIHVAQKDAQTVQKPFLIGYFSGTPSHIHDFRTIERELEELLDEHVNMQLIVVGYMEFSEHMKALIKKKRVVIKPFVSFIELQRLIAEVDLNIVPLVNNTFTNCKSELKFFEAAIVKTITCATPTYVFKKIIKDGENGFLCSPGQWYEKIKAIYEQKYDLPAIEQAAYKLAEKNYYGDLVLKNIETVFDDIYGSKLVKK